jgi:hypothetical protein
VRIARVTLGRRAVWGSIAVAAGLLGTGATAHGLVNGDRHPPAARAAKVEALNEKLSLTITKIVGNTIYAKGTSTGAVKGTGAFYLTLTNATRAKAEMYGVSTHGKLRVGGAASYRVSGPVSEFKGNVTLLSGSGAYAHARSLGIAFKGKLNRQNFKASVELNGKWDY